MVKRLVNWYSDNYMMACCYIVGIPLLGLIILELACYWELAIINEKIAVLQSMF